MSDILDERQMTKKLSYPSPEDYGLRVIPANSAMASRHGAQGATEEALHSARVAEEGETPYRVNACPAGAQHGCRAWVWPLRDACFL